MIGNSGRAKAESYTTWRHFSLAQDKDPSLYVRASWKIGARAQTALTLLHR
jgi:hypothetical protein